MHPARRVFFDRSHAVSLLTCRDILQLQAQVQAIECADEQFDQQIDELELAVRVFVQVIQFLGMAKQQKFIKQETV